MRWRTIVLSKFEYPNNWPENWPSFKDGVCSLCGRDVEDFNGHILERHRELLVGFEFLSPKGELLKFFEKNTVLEKIAIQDEVYIRQSRIIDYLKYLRNKYNNSPKTFLFDILISDIESDFHCTIDSPSTQDYKSIFQESSSIESVQKILDVFSGVTYSLFSGLKTSPDKQGFQAVVDQISSVLKKFDIETIYPQEGESDFDPDFHQCFQVFEDESLETGIEKIEEVFNYGFLYKSKVIKPAAVSVRKGVLNVSS